MTIFRWKDEFLGYWHETDSRPQFHSYLEIVMKRGREVSRRWVTSRIIKRVNKV
jgi:hypothetical protein